MAALPPPEPMRAHRPDVWIKASWVRFMGLTLQTRMVVVRIGEELLLYSPSPAVVDEELRGELDTLGRVRWLLAPNEIHNLGLQAFQDAYPSTHTTGCPGHPRRAPGVRFDVLLDVTSPRNAVPWTSSGDVDFHVIGGNRFLHEIALFHRPSRTLVLTDAVEYFQSGQPGIRLPGRFTQWVLRRMGLRLDEPCMSPEHNLYCVDPDALAGSLHQLECWDFDSIVMAHGSVIEGERSRRALRTAFETTIRAARRRGPLARAIWAAAARLQ